MKKAKCPYCGKKVSYINILMEKTNGEHTCKKCKNDSTIYFVKRIRVAIAITVLTSLIVLLLCTVGTFKGNLWGMLFAAVPFLIFYLSLPVFYRLVPINIEKMPKKKRNTQAIRHNMEGTSSIEPENEYTDISQLGNTGNSTRVIPAIRNGRMRR